MSSPSSDKTLPGIGPDYLKPGALVFHNRYRLIKEIGRGGMGVVWLAEDVHLKDRKLALKFPIGITSWEPAELDHLRAQVLVGQELRHDRLLATFDLAHEPPLAAIVMAYADGHTLKQKLDLHPMHYFEPDEIRPWLLDVLEALTYLHQSKRIVHRDVKPANVIVDDQEDHAVLMDFGISQVIRNTIRHTVSTDQVTHSLVYASPQQLRHLAAAATDDIYSFGAMTYDLLTGRPPFYDADSALIFAQVQNLVPPPIAERRRALDRAGLIGGLGSVVPAAWEQMVARCLAKQPGDRPSLDQIRQVLTTQSLPKEWLPAEPPVIAAVPKPGPAAPPLPPKPAPETKPQATRSTTVKTAPKTNRWKAALFGLALLPALWLGTVALQKQSAPATKPKDGSGYQPLSPKPQPLEPQLPKPKPPEPRPLTLEDARAFVLNYYRNGESPQGRKDRLQSYAPKVSMLYRNISKPDANEKPKTVSPSDIANDDEVYAAKWPKQRYRVEKHTVQPATGGGFDADVDFHYEASNDLQTNKGSRHGYLHFKEVNARFLVDKIVSDVVGEDIPTFEPEAQRAVILSFMKEYLDSCDTGRKGKQTATFFSNDGVLPFFDEERTPLSREEIGRREKKSATDWLSVDYQMADDNPELEGLGSQHVVVRCIVHADGVDSEGNAQEVRVYQQTTLRFSLGGTPLITGVESGPIKQPLPLEN
ncbi:MAG: serine/threonine protein kinase [Verrucomicrobiaceae bacterium]